MTYAKPFLAAALASTVAVALSGCFGFFGLTWSNSNVKPNPPKKSKTVAKVRSQPLLTESQKPNAAPGGLPSRDYPFFLVDTNSETFPFRANKARFDVPGKFGPKGGRKLVRDEDLEAAILDNTDPLGPSVCGNDFGTSTFRVYRTESRVRDRGKVREQTYSTLPFRQTAVTNSAAGGAYISIGTWFDDGDGTVDTLGDDWFGCAGGGFHNLNLKEGSLAPRASRARWDNG